MAIAPLLYQEALEAEQHVNRVTLQLLEKQLRNVVTMTADNSCYCATNRKILNETRLPLIGCASHKFNLAVMNWVEKIHLN